jgi:hypothetical protein
MAIPRRGVPASPPPEIVLRPPVQELPVGGTRGTTTSLVVRTLQVVDPTLEPDDVLPPATFDENTLKLLVGRTAILQVMHIAPCGRALGPSKALLQGPARGALDV